MSRPLVSVITPSLDGRTHLETFLPSVLAQDYPADRIEVIVVDNGSTDGTDRLLAERFPSVRVLANAENAGFARANNQAAEAARGTYLALLNNDLRLDPTWLTTIVGRAERSASDVVCLGSRILTWDGAGVDFAGAAMAFNGIAYNVDDARDGDELLFASGAAVLVDREVFLGVGGFDEDYFSYYEDVDLGWRLWLLGYRVAFCAEAVCYHRRNASIGARHETVRMLERNALQTIVKNYDDESLAIALPAAVALALRRAEARWTATLPPSRRFWRREPRDPTKEGAATTTALREVAEGFPSLLAKRACLQAARRRSDAAIVPLFREPLRVGGEAEVALARELGVARYLERLARAAETPA